MEEQNKNGPRPSDEHGIPDEGPEAQSPLNLEDQVNAVESEEEDPNREMNQLRDTLQRVQADFINYKRRTEEERGEIERYASSRLILKLLPALDDFGLAIDHASKSDAEPSWLEGIKLVQRKLSSLLESETVTKIEVEGREFDPLEHEAMAYQESTEHEEGQIISVVREGYKLHGRVIRPALVMLAKRPADIQEENGPEAEKET